MSFFNLDDDGPIGSLGNKAMRFCHYHEQKKQQKKQRKLISKIARNTQLPTGLFTFAIVVGTLLKCISEKQPVSVPLPKPKRKRKIKPFDPSLIPSDTVRRVPKIKR